MDRIFVRINFNSTLIITLLCCFIGTVIADATTIGVVNRYSGIEQPPYFYALLDVAGYSDVILWGRSPNHPYDFHEVLSGEWGAAVYYDSIDSVNFRTFITF